MSALYIVPHFFVHFRGNGHILRAFYICIKITEWIGKKGIAFGTLRDEENMLALYCFHM
jgi:hypothetical protein